MRIIDRYIGISVTLNVFMVLFVLTALLGFFSFFGQFDEFQNDYGTLEALMYVGYTLPRRAYEVFPIAVLIGGLMGLGSLATHNEIMVIRIAGVSVRRITFSVLKAGMILMALAIALGELVAPASEKRAQDFRIEKKKIGNIALKYKSGYWVRNKKMMINIREAKEGGNLILDIKIYEFDENRKLVLVTHAKKGRYIGGKWLLETYVQSEIGDERHKVTDDPRLSLTIPASRLIDPRLLSAINQKPESMSILNLGDSVTREMANKNSKAAERYNIAFWIKIFTPISTLVMLLVAIPFVFNAVRSTNNGQRLVVGIVVGISFHLMNHAMSQFGIVYGIPAMISAGLPSVVFAVAGIFAIRRI